MTAGETAALGDALGLATDMVREGWSNPEAMLKACAGTHYGWTCCHQYEVQPL